MSDQNIIIMGGVNSHAGYSADQVKDDSITLGDLLAAVEQAISDFGAERRIVIANGDRYGAGYGNISQWTDVFEEPEADEDDDALGYGD